VHIPEFKTGKAKLGFKKLGCWKLKNPSTTYPDGEYGFVISCEEGFGTGVHLYRYEPKTPSKGYAFGTNGAIVTQVRKMLNIMDPNELERNCTNILTACDKFEEARDARRCAPTATERGHALMIQQLE